MNTYVKILALTTTTLVVILVIVNIVISSQVSYWGYQLGEMEKKSRHLEEANRLLAQDIARQTSLTKFQSNAQALGYQSGFAYVHLPQSQPVAFGGLSQP